MLTVSWFFQVSNPFLVRSRVLTRYSHGKNLRSRTTRETTVPDVVVDTKWIIPLIAIILSFPLLAGLSSYSYYSERTYLTFLTQYLEVDVNVL